MDVQLTVSSAAILLPLAAACLAVLVVLRLRYRMSPLRIAVLGALAGYGLGVIWVTLLPFQVNLGRYASQNEWYADLNYVPLLTADLRSFTLNVLMLVPFGILVPLAFPRVDSLWQVARAALLTSVAIEGTQFLCGLLLDNRHSVDINDLIANTLGGMLGYLCLRLLLRSATIQAVATSVTGNQHPSAGTLTTTS